jgi:hypothetical protein
MGQVFGYTIPSITRVEVVGHLTSDFAVNVHFEDLGQSFWIAPEVLEFVGQAADTVVSVGAGKAWTREEDGSWREDPMAVSPTPPRRWWKPW